MKVTLELTKVKETKGTVVFGTDDENAAVSTLYIRKSAFNGGEYPQKVKLTIE